MGRTSAATDHLATLRNVQDKLSEALKLLFELLELYAPICYEKPYRDQARAALQTLRGGNHGSRARRNPESRVRATIGEI